MPRTVAQPTAAARGAAAALAVVLLACAAAPPAPPPPAHAGGLAHHVRWSERLGQGGEPRGEADFARLSADGYRVILSVDGKVPDVAGAARHGLRYVHVPIGYDGFTRAQAAAIVAGVARAEGGVYVHCHHGKHRGPAACALARIVLDGVPVGEALEGLDRTISPAYAGLRRDVAELVPPTAEELDAVGELPAAVTPTDLRGHMIDVDERWDLLREAQARGWRVDPQHPDAYPAQQARLLTESFHEAARLNNQDARLGPELRRQLQDAEEAARSLEQALRSGAGARADDAAEAVAESCAVCHRAFRN